MGTNHSKKPNNMSTYVDYSSNGQISAESAAESLHRLKRRKSNSNANLNRTPSSPVITAKQKPNFEGFRNLDNNNTLSSYHQPQHHHHHHNDRNSFKNNSSNMNSSKSSFSTNTHSTPSPRIPTKQSEPKRFQTAPQQQVNVVQHRQQLQQHHQPPITKRRNDTIIDLNKQMRNNQKKLSNIIKQSDSNHPSYHLSSKLYKPNSLLAANQNLITSPSKCFSAVDTLIKKY